MILQTVKRLTKINNTKFKLVAPLLKIYVIWMCIRKYVKNFNTINICSALTDLCYACSAFDIDLVEQDDFKFTYQIITAGIDNININIEMGAIHLDLRLNDGNVKFDFKNNQFSYSGQYDGNTNNFSEKCNQNIKYEIYGVLIGTFCNVLTYIFNLTPKYKYTI